MPKNVQSTPFAKLKMILQKPDNFHEPFSHNRSGGLWLSGTLHHLLKSSLLIGWHTFTCGVPCGVTCGVTSDWLVTWDSHIQTKEMSAYLRRALLNEISTCGWLCTVVYSNVFTCSYL